MRQKPNTDGISKPVTGESKLALLKKLFPVLLVIGFLVWVGIWLSNRFGPTVVPSGSLATLREDMPMRPGISGIVLSGPLFKPLIFKVDEMRPGVYPIDWNELMARSKPAAIITIEGRIFSDGKLFIDNLHDGGFPAAGSYVRQCVESWFYTPYLNGNIKFTIRIGAKKIYVDATKLRKNNPTGPKVIIDRDRICFIKGKAALSVDEPGNLN